MLALTIISSALLPLVSAWSVAFYTGTNCNSDATFSDAIYAGTGDSDCLIAGAPGGGCIWYTDNGTTEGDCTVPMSPPPGSMMMSTGSQCFPSWASDCTAQINWPGWKQPAEDVCYNISDLHGKTSPELYFTCRDA